MVATVLTSHETTGSTPIPQELERADAERLRLYRENLEFYQGSQWSEPRRRRDRRLTFNYAKAVIEKTASYAMSGVSFVVDPVDGEEGSAERARRAPDVSSLSPTEKITLGLQQRAEREGR